MGQIIKGSKRFEWQMVPAQYYKMHVRPTYNVSRTPKQKTSVAFRATRMPVIHTLRAINDTLESNY